MYEQEYKNHELGGGNVPQAYRNVNKVLRDLYLSLTGNNPEVPDSNRPRQDFNDLVTKLKTLRIDELVDKVERSDLEETLDAHETEMFQQAIKAVAPQYFSLDDVAPNRLKDAIRLNLRDAIARGENDKDLTDLFREAFSAVQKHVGFANNLRAGNNRHSYPMFRWLRELEGIEVLSTGKSFRISRYGGGKVKQWPESPKSLVLRFDDF